MFFLAACSCLSWTPGWGRQTWLLGLGKQVQVELERAMALLEPLAMALSLGLRRNFPSPEFVSPTPPRSSSPFLCSLVHPSGTAEAHSSPQARSLLLLYHLTGCT